MESIGYLYIILLIIGSLLVNNKISKGLRIVLIGNIVITMSVFMGLRYRVGLDSINYLNGYENLPLFSEFLDLNIFHLKYEPGFLLLTWICKAISPEFYIFQCVQSIILNTSVAIFIYKYTKNPFWGLLFYSYLIWPYFNTEILRESLAISIFLLNYTNLCRNKYLRYYLFSILSICFHYSAIILLLFPLVKYIKLNRYYAMACIGILFALPLVNIISSHLPVSSISSRIILYSVVAENLNLNWRIAALIKYMSVPLCTLFVYYAVKINSEYTKWILLQLLFCFGIFAIPIIFVRMTNYTVMFVVLYAANIMSMARIKCICKLSVITVMLLSQIHYYYNMYSAWIPYSSVFTKEKSVEREILWRQSF